MVPIFIIAAPHSRTSHLLTCGVWSSRSSYYNA